MDKHKKVKRKSTKELEADLKQKEEDILRLRADFENYRKHLEKEKTAFIRLSNEQLIAQLLEVLDNFERALPLIKEEKASEGINMIYKQLEKILVDNGLRRIDAAGKKIDPFYHEALLHEESDKEDGTIIEELQKGYMLKDKVIRHSKVKIAKKTLKKK